MLVLREQVCCISFVEKLKLKPGSKNHKVPLENKGNAQNTNMTRIDSQIKMIMTRGKDDPKELYDLLGTKEYRKELDRQFKNKKSNFKIAMVVDMWLTGFDVPFLDSIYIDKPIQQHNLSVSGNSGKTNYRYSFGYLDQDGVVPKAHEEWFL